ncbi:MAG: ParB/RepB/Spo0J family partition protein [Planctomycetes bacterium]|nr:ParB/RepB/Spo0J family partition protein [Planctomycetota bacterium]
MAKKVKKKSDRRLGKGLGGLLHKPVEVLGSGGKVGVPPKKSVDSSGGDSASDADGGLVQLLIDDVAPNPKQPRQVFDDDSLGSLADSIKTAGLMQPIVVRASGNGYEIIAGERRWRAASIAGLTHVPSIIKDLDDRTSAEWALIENLQREDLNPIDRAEAFDRLVVDFNATQQDIASQLGIDRSSVSNFLRLNDLEDSVKDAVRDGRLSMGHAKVLLGVPEMSKCKAIARKCASEQWSVRELERQLKKIDTGAKRSTQKTELSAVEMFAENMSSQLGDHLGTKVKVTLGSKKGTGKLMIEFFDNDQLEGIFDRLGFKPKT